MAYEPCCPGQWEGGGKVHGRVACMKRNWGWRDSQHVKQCPRNQRARSFSKRCQSWRMSEGLGRPVKPCMPLKVMYVTRFQKHNRGATILCWRSKTKPCGSSNKLKLAVMMFGSLLLNSLGGWKVCKQGALVFLYIAMVHFFLQLPVIKRGLLNGGQLLKGLIRWIWNVSLNQKRKKRERDKMEIGNAGRNSLLWSSRAVLCTQLAEYVVKNCWRLIGPSGMN